MKRQIKFRGKSKRTGQWLYGDLLRNVNGDFAIVPPFDMDLHNECSVYEVEEDTIGQFTGLHDKNGKEIYEGDIVSWLFMRVCEMKGEVVFDSIMGCFVIYETDSSNKTKRRWINDLNGIKVIGSIHDNPKLQKGGAE